MNGHAHDADYFSPRKLVDSVLKEQKVLARRYEESKRLIDKELEIRRSAIGGVDNLWLLLVEASDEEFQPHCASTYTLKGKLTKAKVIELLNNLVEMFPRYKMCLKDKGDDFHGARFHEKPGFSVEDHIRVVDLKGKKGKRELDEEVGRLLAEPWDLEKPLWEVELAEDYQDDEGAQSAMIMKGHHLNADGKGYVLSQLALTSYKPEIEEAMGNKVGEPKPPAKRPTKPSEIDVHLRALDPLFANAVTSFFFQLFAVFLVGSLISGLSLAEQVIWSTVHLLRTTYMYATVAWRQQFATGGYFGERAYEREFSVSKTFPLADVRLCQQAFSGLPPGSIITKAYGQKTETVDRLLHHITINDVFCACMADVLAEEMATVGPADGYWPRFVHKVNDYFPPRVGLFIPINIRAPGDWEMTNLTTAAITFLDPLRKPPSAVTPLELYHHVGKAHRELMILKKSFLPRIAWACWNYSLGQLPWLWPFPGFNVKGSFLRRYLGSPIIHGFITSFSAILTNIPGPHDAKVTIGDLEVIRWTALPPQAGKGTLAIGVISYAEAMSVSVAADCIPSTKGAAVRICDGFERRIQFYVDTARQILADSGNLTPP